MFRILASFLLVCSAVTCSAFDNLDLGNPGKADQIVDREGYALGYCEAWEQPRWVTYRLTADEVLNQVTGRTDDFQPDPQIKTGSAQLDDYRGSGYDRGHLAPAADMKWSAKAMRECFYLSNMSPQDRGCNAGIWNEIENTVRGFACSERSVFIVTGPIVSDNPKKIGPNGVAVPDGFYKVVYDETPPEKMIAFSVPNYNAKGKPRDFACSVADVERATGLVFFPKLTGKDALKRSFDAGAWNWSKSQKRPAAKNAVKPSAGFVPGSYASGKREEYSAGNAQPVSSRKAAPVCDKWPETGYWLNSNSNKRHNKNCPNYRKTRGYPCEKNEGKPCGICGG